MASITLSGSPSSRPMTAIDIQQQKLKAAMEKRERIGSIHRYRDGYGFGMTVPTARNKPTLPPSVAMYRHPPEFSETPSESFYPNIYV